MFINLDEKKFAHQKGSGGFTLSTPLVVRTLKKHFFMCVFPYKVLVHNIASFHKTRLQRMMLQRNVDRM